MSKFWTDTHCHVNYMENQDEILQRSADSKVTKIICISTDIDENHKIDRVLELAEKNAIDARKSIGIHPLSCDKYSTEEINKYLNTSSLNKVVAVGETGLDDFRTELTSAQISSFETHIEFAIKKALPVVMHLRMGTESKVEKEARRIIEKYRPKGIAHCFNGSPELAEFLIRMGWYISFSGMITYKKMDLLKSIAASIPIDRILIETDAPFLPPQHLRGTKNEPANVVYVGQELAKIRNISEEECMRITSENAEKIFGF